MLSKDIVKGEDYVVESWLIANSQQTGQSTCLLPVLMRMRAIASGEELQLKLYSYRSYWQFANITNGGRIAIRHCRDVVQPWREGMNTLQLDTRFKYGRRLPWGLTVEGAYRAIERWKADVLAVNQAIKLFVEHVEGVSDER